MTNPFKQEEKKPVSFASVEMRKNSGFSNWLRIILIILAIVAVFTLVEFKSNVNHTEKTSTSPTPSASASKTIMDASKDQIEGYYRVYQNPSVIFLRKALNAYLADDGSKTCILEVAVKENKTSGIVSGLDSFSKDYYKSKFVVATIDKNKENGTDIQIIFQEKPDRIFYAWVGKNPQNETCLIGFNSKENIDQKALKDMLDYYGPLLFDKTYAL